LLLAALLIAGTASAGPGHDHGDGAPAVAGKASPRFDAHSDLFEVVGVLRGGELSITIDRYATNTPVLDAKLEIESGTFKAIAQFHPEHGDYRVPSRTFEKPGSYPITLTLTVGEEWDILAGNLVVPDSEAGHDHTTSAMSWKGAAAIAALVLVFGIVGTLLIRRRSGRIRHV
ncbi:MAG: hypothetical protein LW845_16695, partial [Flammeovirgaceae bacterium]|nr:hypothetical protein [Flammeovirgaceae bacterium]